MMLQTNRASGYQASHFGAFGSQHSYQTTSICYNIEMPSPGQFSTFNIMTQSAFLLPIHSLQKPTILVHERYKSCTGLGVRHPTFFIILLYVLKPILFIYFVLTAFMPSGNESTLLLIKFCKCREGRV